MIEDLMSKITSLAKRRGFIFPGSEIYGGIAGFYDYGPLGVELKNNIKKLWWQEMVYKHDEIVGLDSAIITHPKVWEASGHVTAFTDPLIECRSCHKRFRADNLENISDKQKSKMLSKQSLTDKNKEYIKNADKVCPDCGYAINTHVDTPKQFNLLMKTYLGTVEGEKDATYLRGETCQGIYLNYKNVLDSMWKKIPFGIAQIGKAFRNEITPGNFTFRTREFEQMEMQWFIKADLKESEKWFTYWKEERMKWYLSLGFKKENLRFRDHEPEERAHYAKAATDIEYNSPFSWKEFEGIHNRSDWDLSRHSKFSGVDLLYTNNETKDKYIPWIIETSAGADRMTLFALLDAYHEEPENKRVVLKFHPKLAPVKVAVFPLMANKQEIVDKAKSIFDNLKLDFHTMFDDIGNVGKRYRRQDEIGTPWCVTVDYQSLEDDTVTVRDRDNMQQERIKISELPQYFTEKLK
ncbi:glycine--tRNA ligase [candidate division CPR3 bacterium GWF2_35_18]|uniref:Glycine--tRNA ligase n=1 Tax=candidate division CPR3 bacterium GW2011_GWF2_35_18 TaxID=1618350 RepID=A0A0G0BLC6_UNCC3|nr:MAG: Glycyl-tRNA synthetase [candidate division CPR3 bacterium GW2011_GWF2_35_18]KKP86446.1 MAG: Glycyl-tRNA synthetase [candidate division CPR3 bacterium GW2011_GWE2_35_7]OGB63513.1 MAG: glycine--tRNA ligase [candidate division CPR3 bacterium GWF2_35_18]OGB64742.1 MAG: glycine--tRNA ligase [candidate division CPR3 bacterium RIFOXYA2_FULL_35_13]OGB78465.1 MAG: glycine--tRNA ligase [candidate division CPR3 bacterium RIFOXYB2_FULL_35_8]OGB80347.1 MAG: glycine--tRNA ligase [candidate division 